MNTENATPNADMRSNERRAQRLDRRATHLPAAPVRIIHLGVGNFARAHQAWYTNHAADADRWGIAAFTGRSATVAEQLQPQEGLYHLLVRDPAGDRTELVGSISQVHAADDLVMWRHLFADPQVVVVTSTITEAGYLASTDGHLRTDHAHLRADLTSLRNDPEAVVETAPARLVAGLLARRHSGAGNLTFCPCDNVPHNGAMLESVLREAAGAVDPSLISWIEEHVGFVTTMVDRITPRTTDADRLAVESETGFADAAPVVTEPFTEWVLSGQFMTDRPNWESAGARFVRDIGPHEDRKLRLLNGAHTLMAFAGPLLGCRTVRDAIANPELARWVEEWWTEASETIDLPPAELRDYTEDLRERFANPRIEHLLKQISTDGSQKIAIRIVPVLKERHARGADVTAASRVIAAWVLHLRRKGSPVQDAASDKLLELVHVGDANGAHLAEDCAAVVDWLDIPDARVTEQVFRAAADLRELAGQEQSHEHN